MVFSRGYGLEDDEKAVGDHSFTFTVGDDSVIQALNDAIPGMQGNVFFILLVLFVCVCAVCAVMAWRIMVLVAYRQFTHSVIVVLHPSIFLLINDTITNTDPTIHTHKQTQSEHSAESPSSPKKDGTKTPNNATEVPAAPEREET